MDLTCNILRLNFNKLSGATLHVPCMFLFFQLINQQWVVPAIASLGYSAFVLWQKAGALIRSDDLFSIMRIDSFTSARPNIVSLSFIISNWSLHSFFLPHIDILQRCVAKWTKWSTVWLMNLISSWFDFTVTAHFSPKAFWLLDLSLCQKVKPLIDECVCLSSPDTHTLSTCPSQKLYIWPF